MSKRVFWFAVGAGVTIYVVAKARKYAQEHSPEALIDKVQSGLLMIHRDGQRLTDPTAIRDGIASWIDRALESFARMALLVG